MKMSIKIFFITLLMTSAIALLILGFFGALSQFAAYTAFSLANLGYVTSIFRLQSIFIILLAALFLKEKDIREKLLGALVMLIGAVLVAI